MAKNKEIKKPELAKMAEYLRAEHLKLICSSGYDMRTDKAFADYLGIKADRLSMYMNAEEGPAIKNAAKIAKKLGPEILSILGYSDMADLVEGQS
ncbi:MAG: helix-turn-helix domain-containing protein [Anaerolineales bacterium]|nr:MAG: helix-turn-helix domain-containing protein [Anaerolineales bacterium]